MIFICIALHAEREAELITIQLQYDWTKSRNNFCMGEFELVR